jgi:16S rRNA processing protein RimM
VPTESPGEQEWVTIAQLLGSRGNRGEVEAVPLSNQPERFSQNSEVYLFDGATPNPRHRAVEVEEVWKHGGRVIFKFRGVDTIDDAARLRGNEVRVPLRSRLPLPEGEYYQSDLVGCEVVERATGERVGLVRGWNESGGTALLEVEGQGGEILIPFAGSICVEIDPLSRRIVVELPEGLKELNR